VASRLDVDQHLSPWLPANPQMGVVSLSGLKLARQEWNTLLDLIAGKVKRELGDDYDLTWIVVYANGPAKDLGRYFSNGNKPVGSTLLDPSNMQQRAEYERTLKEIFKYTYELRRVGNVDTIVKTPR